MKISLGCKEVSPQGGYRETYLEIPDEQSPQAVIADPSLILMEMQLGPVVTEGYRLVTVEPDGQIAQEFNLAPDVAYDLFLEFKKIDEQK